jgi:hypothetical protein
MLIRRFILGLALLLGSFQPAAAAQSCEGVDNVLQTASVLRGGNYLESKTQYSETIFRLENTLSRISLPALQPEPYREAFPTESRELFDYVSNLRRAVMSAKAGYDEDALEILGASDPATISDSLLSLNRYWSCTDSLSAGDINDPVEGKSAFENDTPLSSSETGDISSASFSEGKTIAEKKAYTGDFAPSVSNGPKLDIQGHPFLSIAMALSLIALIYGWRKYSKRSRMRDYRHLIHQNRPFRLGNKDYQMVVIDITQRGLKFKHDGLIKRQRRVAIELNGEWYTCRLVWKNANFAGAKFRTPLNDKTMEALLAAAHPEGTMAAAPTNGAPNRPAY